MALYSQESVPVTCLVYASERRLDEPKQLKLTVDGIELRSVGLSTPLEPDLIPWSWILGASESTSSIRRRFVPIYMGTEFGEEKEMIIFGCIPKCEGLDKGRLFSGLLSLVTGSKDQGVERAFVQWVFRCEDENGHSVAFQTIKAIKLLADPRSLEKKTKLMDPYGVLPPRKFMVVINPAGGRGHAQQIYEHQVAPVLEQANVEVETVITRYSTHATEILKEIPLKKYDCIVAVGGDGLLSEMLQGLMQRKDWQQAILQPLGIIPGGSGNGLSASLLARAGERFHALNAAYSIAKGEVQELDLFSATNGHGKVMYGVLSLEWAFIADMDIKSERYRFFGDMRFFIASALQIFGFGQTNYPGRVRYLVSKDDEPLPEKYHDVFSQTETTATPVCACLDKEQGEEKTETWQEMEGPFYMFWSMNVSHAAADAHIAPPAKISDGYIHLMLVSGESYSRLGLAKLMTGIDDGSHLGIDRVQIIRTRAFTVRASNADDLMCVDGELFSGPEVKIEVLRALGRVLCLPGKHK